MKKYFEYWCENDSVKMNSLMAKPYDGLIISVQNITYDFMDDFYFKSVKLLSSKKDENESWYTGWGKEPYGYAIIRVSFDFKYRDWLAGGYYGLENGINACAYDLIKENKNSDWRILTSGNG